jgi:hypothetical protein
LVIGNCPMHCHTICIHAVIRAALPERRIACTHKKTLLLETTF